MKADWSRTLLEEAVETARNVVRSIREGNFEFNQHYDGFPMFPRICQTTVLGLDDDAEGDDA